MGPNIVDRSHITILGPLLNPNPLFVYDVEYMVYGIWVHGIWEFGHEAISTLAVLLIPQS